MVASGAYTAVQTSAKPEDLLTNHFSPAADLPPRQAAVLILFSPLGADDLALLFTQRALNVAHHKGQICFPGGRQDADDHTLTHTALREAEEEIDVHPQRSDNHRTLLCGGRSMHLGGDGYDDE